MFNSYADIIYNLNEGIYGVIAKNNKIKGINYVLSYLGVGHIKPIDDS